jgi:RNase P subunit RPR2
LITPLLPKATAFIRFRDPGSKHRFWSCKSCLDIDVSEESNTQRRPPTVATAAGRDNKLGVTKVR